MDIGKTIQWFPGHMTKTRRQLEKSLPLVDLLLELRDARIPESSRNPMLEELTGSKPRLVVLNKADIADEVATAEWLRFLIGDRLAAVAMDCRSGKGVDRLLPAVRRLMENKRSAWAAKGMATRPLRAMVVGIPNVGKSSLINRLAGGGRARVEDRPGVTRGNQWFKVSPELELLDTPGVLWPKFESPTAAAHLAFTGAIRDQVLDEEALAQSLLALLWDRYPQALKTRYKWETLPDEPGRLLELVARKRGMLLSGGIADTQRAAVMVLDEFRGAKFGRITLERPAEEKPTDADRKG